MYQSVKILIIIESVYIWGAILPFNFVRENFSYESFKKGNAQTIVPLFYFNYSLKNLNF